MPIDAHETVNAYLRELRELIKKRRVIQQQIADLRAALSGLARMLPEETRNKLLAELREVGGKPVGMTEAICQVLEENANRELSPSQVRRTLDQINFDLSGYSHPLAAVSTTLHRLARTGRAKRTIKDKQVTYRWI